MFERFSKKRTKMPPFMGENPAYAAYDIGAWTYGVPTILSWGEDAKLQIGKYCSIAEGVKIFLGGEHRTDWITTYPFNVVWPEARNITGSPKTRGDVIIENDVWIGRDALIISGVRIGNGAVIGAGSVVTKNVAPYTIVAGNPAKVIRERFTLEQRTGLLKINWWNWPEAQIRADLPVLLSGKVDEFIQKHASTPS
jgi:acetyltransferase-like isoleucine patch superfamily enzyme